jgi:hypothetical protein
MLNRNEIAAIRNFVLRAGDGTRPIKGEETQNHVAVLQALQREEQFTVQAERNELAQRQRANLAGAGAAGGDSQPAQEVERAVGTG